VFEVPADATGLVDAVPLTAMGRFNHEAACVDPATGIVYMTEDRDDGVLYRFVPAVPGILKSGGRLQAMVIGGLADTRNWQSLGMARNQLYFVSWIDLDEVEAPEDDLRLRASAPPRLAPRGLHAVRVSTWAQMIFISVRLAAGRDVLDRFCGYYQAEVRSLAVSSYFSKAIVLNSSILVTI
jgi:hypothetical protein